ncbi:MAG: CotH kinase family protein, partial [Bacteroidetes bacterium]|nr:CotH kinase family protein [Bacteroidota bacterium]
MKLITVMGLWAYVFSYFSLFMCLHGRLEAQQAISPPARGERLYNDSFLGRIDVFLPPDSLAEMLANPNSNREYRSTVVFTRAGIQDSLFECGLRIRGNTSRNAQKKQFRISFNSFRPGQNLEGISDLNLYGMHNDPSISRAKFYYDLTHRVGGRSAR